MKALIIYVILLNCDRHGRSYYVWCLGCTRQAAAVCDVFIPHSALWELPAARDGTALKPLLIIKHVHLVGRFSSTAERFGCVQDAVGKQVLSTMSSSPSPCFETSQRP